MNRSEPITSAGSVTRRFPLLIVVLAAALGLRLLAAVLVQRVVDRGATARVCIFPDTEYYWFLARTIREGAPYDIIEWETIHHYALRTPGYPLFLAACEVMVGERPLAIRLIQAVLGTLAVWLVYRLTRQVVSSADDPQGSTHRVWTEPLIAAAIAALNPYYIAMSELILSEALFVPLMLLTLWGLAVLWRPPDEADRPERRSASRPSIITAIGTGISGGAAILTRPSWGLFLPGALLVWVMQGMLRRNARMRKTAFEGAVLVVVGVVLVMGPWWIRNARIYGRFVPTAIWFGACLYDGLNRDATGASDMTFLADPGLRSFDESGRDAALCRGLFASPGQIRGGSSSWP